MKNDLDALCIFFMKPSLSKYLHVPLFHLLCTKAVVP